MKHILIENCDGCPNRDHRGAFSAIQYVPYCSRRNKDLGFAISISKEGRGVASYDGVIPDWCPLEDCKNGL